MRLDDYPEKLFWLLFLCWLAGTFLIFSSLDEGVKFIQHKHPNYDIDEDGYLHQALKKKDTANRFENPVNKQSDVEVDKNELLQTGQIVALEEIRDDEANTKRKEENNIIKNIQKYNQNSYLQAAIEVEFEIGLYPDIELPPAVYDGNDPSRPGEGGREVLVNESALTKEEKIRFYDGRNKHQFNEYASNMISIHRSMPDVRHSSCQRDFRSDLPATSILICFHNEAWSVLLRTVHSVLNRSPPNLVKEIILIDDFSDMDHLKRPLEKYMSTLQKVRILRSKKREGLIRARLIGVAAAKASIVTFLDSHVECFQGWLEPLLDRVSTDETVIVSPVVDMLSEKTFGLRTVPTDDVGGFELNDPHFIWIPAQAPKSNQSYAEPSKSPTIAGGLLSMNKDFFYRIGAYDEGMDIWGYENVELSLRVWMCGGAMEIHPCSHVAHVYRFISPYNWGDEINNILRKNSVRMAEVWLDDYKRHLYQHFGYNLGNYGDVSERKRLRERLSCHSFQWYIDNVYPSIKIPPKTVFIGEIKSKTTMLCMDSMTAAPSEVAEIHVMDCHGQRGNQLWRTTTQEDIRIYDGCLSYQEGSKKITFSECTSNDYQKWKITEDGKIIHTATNMCIQLSDFLKLSLQPCVTSDAQIWIFQTTQV